MKRALDVVKAAIADLKSSTQATLSKLSVEDVALKQIRRDLKLGDDDPVVIDGVAVVAFEDPREPRVMRATVYANLRWQRGDFTVAKAKEVLGALSLEELGDVNLVSIIVDQHMDAIGAADPVDDMDADEADALRDSLKELGIDDPSI